MNQAKNIARWRKQIMSNRDRNQVEPVTEPGSVPGGAPSVPADWYDCLPALDCRTPSVTKTALGARIGLTEGAIRKAVRMIQQAVPIDVLEVKGRLTPLAEFLVTQHFNRPSNMRALEWIDLLKKHTEAIPNPRVLSRGQDLQDRSGRIRDKTQQTAALATQSQDDLDGLLDEYSAFVDLNEKEGDADLALVDEEAYAAETRKLTVAFRARMRAQADFSKKLEARGLA